MAPRRHATSYILIPLSTFPMWGELSLRANYEVHQRLTDEKHIWQHDRELTQLSNEPERARAIFAVYWEGRIVETGGIVKAIVGEDWILQRKEDGALKIALYINAYHHLLPDSASHLLTNVDTDAARWSATRHPNRNECGLSVWTQRVSGESCCTPPARLQRSGLTENARAGSLSTNMK